MAGGQNIGFLNFGIDGDDKEIKKKLDAIKSDAVSIEKIFKNIKIDAGGGNKLSTDIQKAQIAADKLAKSKNVVAESAHKVQRAEEQLNNERKKGSVLEGQRAKESARAAIEVKRSGEIELNMLLKKEKAQRDALSHELKLEGIKKRNEQIGVKSQQGFKRSIDDSNKSLDKQGIILTGLEKKLMGAFSGYQLARFAKEIITVRGEFEGLEVAFETMLGSADKSRKMMSEITTMALQTPFTVKDVADNVKQLIAMGIESEKVMDTMKALGDVSAGLSVPMWRIAINYGQVATLGRLQQREIRDFAMAGVPIVEELANVLGKTKSEVTDLVSAGKVGFPVVEEAFRRLAAEGGRFHNMMEKRNATMLGQMNRLEDQVQLMMNAIGKSNEGVIYGAISAASTLVEHYETVGKVMLSLVVTYGVYKAAIIANNLALRIQSEMALQAALATNTLSTSQRVGAVAATNWSRSMKALNATMLANPYVLAAAAIVGMGFAIYEVANTTTALEDGISRLADSQSNLNHALATSESELDSYNTKLIDASENEEEFKKIKDAIVAKYGDYYEGLEGEIERVGNLSTAYDALNQSLSDSIAQRELTASRTEEEDRFTKIRAKNMAKLRERLAKEFSDPKEVARLYKSASDYIYKDVTMSPEIEKTLKQAGMWSLSGQLYKYVRNIKKEADATSLVLEGLDEIAKQYNTTTENISKDDDQFTFKGKTDQIKSAREEIAALKKDLEALDKGIKPSTIGDKEQYDFAKGVEDKTKELKAAEEKLNYLLHGRKGKTERDFKDPQIASLEKRIGLLKTARQEYEKLSRIMDADSAFSEINKNDAFKGISKEDITSAGYLRSIDAIMMEASKLKASDQLNKFNASLFTLKAETAAKIAKESADLLEKELSKYKDQYNLYEALLGISGNKEQSISLAFGDQSATIRSYKDKLKEAIEGTDNSDLKEKFEKELFSIRFTEQADFAKQMAELVKKYQTIEEQITAIKTKGIEERQKITDRYGDSPISQKMLDASIKAQKEQIDALESESLKLTPFYQRLFGDIGNYGARALDSIINKTEDLLASIKASGKNSKGLYSVEIDGSNVSLTEADIARLTKQLGKLRIELTKSNPFRQLKESIKEYNEATIDEKPEALSKLGVSANNAGDAVKQLSNDLATLFDTLGEEDAADAIAFIGELGGSMANAAAGFASGNYIQGVQGILQSLTAIFNLHDKKLDKQIKRSQLEVKKLQGSYESLSRFIDRKLGAVTEKQAQDQIDNLKKQQIELQKQQQAEEKKKKKDKSAIEDYKNSINEIEDQIKYFYEELFSEQYGLELKSIADQLSSALVDAFKSGEDAAISFDKTVANIINDLAAKMISLEIIQPAMDSIRDYLFGNNGVFNDGELSVSDAQGLVSQLADLKGSIGKSKEIWDALNEAAEQAGIDLSEGSAKDTLSKGIQSVTEDTANLLASYMNAIRADVSIKKEIMLQMLKIAQVNQVSFGKMLAELMRIQINTFNTANNTREIADTVKSTNDILKSATIKNGGTGWNIL